MKITIVAPAYNEENKIEDFLKDIKLTTYPVVIVDDGSTDNTSSILSKIHNPNSGITVLRHEVNLGKGEALKTGCDYAFKNGADAVIIMDSDGQHNVTDAEKLANKLKNGSYGLVFGSRVFKGDIPLERFLYNKFASVLVNILFQNYISDILCGFRGFTKKAYKKIKWNSGGYSVEAEMVVRAIKQNIKFCEVGVSTVYYDKYKGVSVNESIEIFIKILYWKIFGI